MSYIVLSAPETQTGNLKYVNHKGAVTLLGYSFISKYSGIVSSNFCIPLWDDIQKLMLENLLF